MPDEAKVTFVLDSPAVPGRRVEGRLVVSDKYSGDSVRVREAKLVVQSLHRTWVKFDDSWVERVQSVEHWSSTGIEPEVQYHTARDSVLLSFDELPLDLPTPRSITWPAKDEKVYDDEGGFRYTVSDSVVGVQWVVQATVQREGVFKTSLKCNQCLEVEEVVPSNAVDPHNIGGDLAGLDFVKEPIDVLARAHLFENEFVCCGEQDRGVAKVSVKCPQRWYTLGAGKQYVPIELEIDLSESIAPIMDYTSMIGLGFCIIFTDLEKDVFEIEHGLWSGAMLPEVAAGTKFKETYAFDLSEIPAHFASTQSRMASSIAQWLGGASEIQDKKKNGKDNVSICWYITGMFNFVDSSDAYDIVIPEVQYMPNDELLDMQFQEYATDTSACCVPGLKQAREEGQAFVRERGNVGKHWFTDLYFAPPPGKTVTATSDPLPMYSMADVFQTEVARKAGKNPNEVMSPPRLEEHISRGGLRPCLIGDEARAVIASGSGEAMAVAPRGRDMAGESGKSYSGNRSRNRGNKRGGSRSRSRSRSRSSKGSRNGKSQGTGQPASTVDLSYQPDFL